MKVATMTAKETVFLLEAIVFMMFISPGLSPT